MRFLVILMILVAYPAAEIAGFIYVGRHLGILPTLLLLLAVSAAGISLMRLQGFGILGRINAASSRGDVPGRELGHGALVLLAGLLLLLPGFLSDILALLLLLAPIRNLVIRHFMKNMVVASRGFARGSGRPQDGTTIIDLEADDYAEAKPDRPSTSPWLHRPGEPD